MKELLALAVAALFVSCGPRSAGNAASGTAPEEVRTPVEMAETIALVKPELKGGLTINEALQNRRSWREYAPEALSLEELSGVLWAAAGINRPENDHLTAPLGARSLSAARLCLLCRGHLPLRCQGAPAGARQGG